MTSELAMSSCIFCQEEDDVRDMKIYGSCEVSGGKPCGPCTEYLELEAQIVETRRTLEQQLGRRREIRKNINRVHDAMLIRVPREITAHIFEFASSVDDSPDGTDSKFPLEGELYAPLPLGRVCSAWRNIAWGMPQLWNFMFAHIRTVEDFPSRFDVAKQWLSRSGDYLPLSIHFRLKYHEGSQDTDPWGSKEFLPFMDLLNLYSHRWKDLCGVCPPYLFEHLSAENRGAPILRKLSITSTRLTDGPVIFNLGCQQLPQPRSVRLSTLVDMHIKIDWSQVTYIDTDCPCAMCLLELLPRLPNLTDLGIFKIDGDLRFVASVDDPVTHLKLQSLNLNCLSPLQDPDRICNLLNFLTFPSLRHLTINLVEDRDLLNTVNTFIRRSTCNLVSLSLSNTPYDSQELVSSLLELAHAIEELEISIPKCSTNHVVLEVLHHHLQRQPLLRPLPFSRLQCLRYITPSPTATPWNVLLNIFNPSRLSDRPRLRTLSLGHDSMSPKSQDFIDRHLRKDTIQGLLNLIDAGIDLLCPGKISREHLLDLMKS